ncbi:MAG TPA: GTP-binding protein, partial [Saprospiraceae bacterium]|nr:GTP-binding protein [Saprospiraceae bacterium]
MMKHNQENTDKSTELLRFTTAGSVDDGKSTLIGRLLYDSKSIFQDQYDAIEEVSKRRGEENINLALLTDGLKAEREQGITIDVAYRYFSTPRRKFIIADTPGHIQYTRNMVTGASTANVALILIDARLGVLEQTRRHAIIASLLQIPHLVVCINKMDLVEYSQEVYERIQEEFEAFASKLDVHDVSFIPISALKGDNIVSRSTNMNWYEGSTLLYYLENVHIASDHNFIDCRFPVQYVVRPYNDEYHDYRGYAGRIAGGIFKRGDEVMLLPSGFTTKISRIETYDGDLEEAFPPMSVTLHIADDFDISRGDMIVRVNNVPRQEQDLDLMICWFNEKPLQERGKYVLRHTTKEARCIIREI